MAAIISVACGFLGLLLFAIFLGPVAVVAGFVGEHQARRGGRKLGRLALLGILLGAFCTLIGMTRLGLL